MQINITDCNSSKPAAFTQQVLHFAQSQILNCFPETAQGYFFPHVTIVTESKRGRYHSQCMHLNTPATSAEVQDDVLGNSCVSFGLHLWQTGESEKQFYGQLETSCYNDNHHSEGMGKENTNQWGSQTQLDTVPVRGCKPKSENGNIHVFWLYVKIISLLKEKSSCSVQPAHMNQSDGSVLLFSIISPWYPLIAYQYSTSRLRPCSLTTASFLSKISDQRIGILCQETAWDLCSTSIYSFGVAITTKK